jgi:hypothetical protein
VEQRTDRVASEPLMEEGGSQAGQDGEDDYEEIIDDEVPLLNEEGFEGEYEISVELKTVETGSMLQMAAQSFPVWAVDQLEEGLARLLRTQMIR